MSVGRKCKGALRRDEVLPLFSDEEVFKGMVLPKETSTISTEEADPQNAGTTPAGTP